MPGLVIYRTKGKKFFREYISKLRKIFSHDALLLKEDYITYGNFLFYRSYPRFIDEQQISEIDGRIIGIDGMIYNKSELSKRLKRATIFSTTELINLLFEKYGRDFIKFINGEFVIFIFDKKTQRLYIFNDIFARRPLFYFTKEDELFVSSEKKAILLVLENKQLDYLGLLEVFTLRHNIRGRTFIENIKALLPASTLVYRQGSVSVQNYYKWSFTSSRQVFNKQETIEKLAFELKKAIKIRLHEKNGSILWLSGGYDSRAIACFIEPSDRNKVITGTIGEKFSPELKIAKEVSETLGFSFNKFSVSIDAFLLAQIGAWRSEFAVSAYGHPYPAIYKDLLVKKIKYFIIGLPGLDTLIGCYIKPKIVLFSLFPNSLERIYSYYKLFNNNFLLKIFNTEFLEEYSKKVKQEFFESFEEVMGDNILDRYDVWFTVERQSQYSHMADLVEKGIFETIAPFTDIEMQKLFVSIPLKHRIYQQVSLDLIYQKCKDLRNIPYDAGRGKIKKNNNIRTYLFNL